MTQDTFMGRSIYPMRKRPGVPQGARVYPVTSGKKRLQLTAFQAVIDALRDLVKLPADLFDNTYQKLMIHYADFAQLMPERMDFPAQSMLGNSIKRSFVLTEAFQRLLLAARGPSFVQSDQGARLLFAVFSSSLLFRVAKLVADKHIVLCDQSGKFSRNWLYFSGPMKRQGQFFKWRTTQAMTDALVSDMTIVLAKQLMPTIAFAWLSEDTHVLQAWFRALNILDAFFGLHQMALEVEALMRESSLNLAHEEDYQVGEDTLKAEEFWEWLMDHIDELGSDATLDADGIGLVDGTLLFDVDTMLKRYAAHHTINKEQVLDQLRQLGLVQAQGAEICFRQLHHAAQSGVASSSMYAQQERQGDKLDAKRFVGVDATIASAYFKGFNHMSNEDGVVMDKLGLQIFQRLASVFFGHLADGIDLVNQVGGGL